MGTQQILMIILSVIVVGAAVAAGIQMFNTNSYNQEKMALQSEMIQMAVMAQTWYRTPKIMGGGHGLTSVGPAHVPTIARYIAGY